MGSNPDPVKADGDVMEDLMGRMAHLIEGLKTQPKDVSPLWGTIAYSDDESHCCQRELVLQASILPEDGNRELVVNHLSTRIATRTI